MRNHYIPRTVQKGLHDGENRKLTYCELSGGGRLRIRNEAKSEQHYVQNGLYEDGLESAFSQVEMEWKKFVHLVERAGMPTSEEWTELERLVEKLPLRAPYTAQYDFIRDALALPEHMMWDSLSAVVVHFDRNVFLPGPFHGAMTARAVGIFNNCILQTGSGKVGLSRFDGVFVSAVIPVGSKSLCIFYVTPEHLRGSGVRSVAYYRGDDTLLAWFYETLYATSGSFLFADSETVAWYSRPFKEGGWYNLPDGVRYRPAEFLSIHYTDESKMTPSQKDIAKGFSALVANLSQGSKGKFKEVFVSNLMTRMVAYGGTDTSWMRTTPLFTKGK